MTDAERQERHHCDSIAREVVLRVMRVLSVPDYLGPLIQTEREAARVAATRETLDRVVAILEATAEGYGRDGQRDVHVAFLLAAGALRAK